MTPVMTPVRTLGLVTLALLACALLAAVPVFAATSNAPATAVQPPAVAAIVQPIGAALGCGEAQPTGLFAALAQAGFSAPPERLAGPACPLGHGKAVLGEPAGKPKPFRGFCACSCAVLPDCNTSVDCGGAACLPARTCC